MGVRKQGLLPPQKFKCVYKKLSALQNALENGEVGDTIVGVVKRLNALDIHDGIGGAMLVRGAEKRVAI